MKPMIDEMDKRWVCPKCDRDSTNESGPCEECLEEMSDEMNIPTEVIKEFADDTQDFDLSDIKEAYADRFDSDKDFAMDMADNTGAVDLKNQPWPLYCIDWEYAARELMMDYTEYNGYYFRNV